MGTQATSNWLKKTELPSHVTVGSKNYPINYQPVSGLRSSVRIRGEEVVLRLSRFLHDRQRDETVEKFLQWASRKLGKVSRSDFLTPQYCDGGTVWTHNKIYLLQVYFYEKKVDRAFLRDGGVIEIWISRKTVKPASIVQELAEKVVIQDQTDYLCAVIDELNQLYFQEKYNGCRFKRMRGRFGSCSSRRNINIALRLLFAPKEIFRYVCAHELAHLKEFNHSRRFWELVAGAMPDYKKSEKWLRENGFALG